MYGSLENFRIVRNGPPIASGCTTAFTREPSGRRASTIGVASSMRRPTWLTILSIMRRRCASSTNSTSVALELAAALDVDRRRAVHHDFGDARVVRRNRSIGP